MMDDLWVNVKAVGFKAESISDYALNEEFKFVKEIEENTKQSGS